jgi:hypothetical protein
MSDFDDASLPGTMKPLPQSPQEMRARISANEREELLAQTPYPMFCFQPEKCAGKSCCQRSIACCD